MDTLRCTESFAVDTTLLLTRVLSEMAFHDGHADVNSDVSTLFSDCASRHEGDATDVSTNNSARHCGDSVAVSLSYTRVSKETSTDVGRWNFSKGFPFPCPIVRDPKKGGLYIPGEQLRLHFAQRRVPPYFVDVEEMTTESSQTSPVETEDSSISLREVIRQVPIRLSHMRNGELDDHLYDAWLYGDPKESLKDRFARMDRGLRSKFIGLKNSSARVREKVRRKRVTSYKEVAEELVEEIGLTNAKDRPQMMEAENLKRRVYDVLNVFEAVGLIVKDQKCIYWKGFAESEDRELDGLERHLEWLKTRLEKRRRYLEQIEGNYRALTALCTYNKTRHVTEAERLHLPFLLLHVPESVKVDVTVASKKVQLDFGQTFRLCGDLWALRRLGWHRRPSSFSQKLSNEATPREVPYIIESGPGLTACLDAASTDVPSLMHPFLPLTVENAVESIDLELENKEEPMPKRRRTCNEMTFIPVHS